jgi:hypothetical protein
MPRSVLDKGFSERCRIDLAVCLRGTLEARANSRGKEVVCRERGSPDVACIASSEAGFWTVLGGFGRRPGVSEGSRSPGGGPIWQQCVARGLQVGEALDFPVVLVWRFRLGISDGG